MALKITLKSKEKMIIGGAVLVNPNTSSCDLVIENRVPILRQKNIMNEVEADSPCRRIYFVIQLMYIDERNLVEYHNTYWNLVQDVVQAAPSITGLLDAVSEHILNRRYYQALKMTQQLIDFEQEVISRVK
jgi:flagellar protein FlbT